MLPEWKVIDIEGIPENDKSVIFIDVDNCVYIGTFKTHVKGEYKGKTFLEARQKNDTNGMFGSYVHKWHNIRHDDAFDFILRWDYLPMY